MRSVRLLEYAISKKPETVLDIAVGPGYHAMAFIANGSKVTGMDVTPAKIEHPDYTHLQSPYELTNLDEKFDMVFSCHTLEHIPNPQHFLVHLAKWCKDDGWLAISVPPSKDRLHVGHLTLWTPAHLVYNLICAGWDCRDAIWYTEYMSIGLMVQKKPELDLSWRTGLPSETLALNQFTPIIVNHEDNAWWPDNWHEETTDVAEDPPMVTVGRQITNKPPERLMPHGPNPKLRKEPGRTWRC
jgi:SAM-dependent methyltransferase